MTLPILYARLTAVMAGPLAMHRCSLMFVDDGSTDGSGAALEALQAQDRRVHRLVLSRRFGHQAALAAGLDHAYGDAVISMDGDLQDPPEAVAALVATWRAGADVAYGVRRRRDGDGWAKRWGAATFYRALQRLADAALPRDCGDFRLLDRRVVQCLRNHPASQRYARGTVAWVGFTQVAVYYDRAPRWHGRSRYGLGQMLRLAAAGLAGHAAPWRLGLGWLLLTVATLPTGLGLLLLPERTAVTGLWSGGTALPASAAFALLWGVQMVGVAASLAFMAALYQSRLQRPLYIVATRGVQAAHRPRESRLRTARHRRALRRG